MVLRGREAGGGAKGKRSEGFPVSPSCVMRNSHIPIALDALDKEPLVCLRLRGLHVLVGITRNGTELPSEMQ